MTDLKHWADEDATSEELELLRHGRERLSPKDKERLIAAVQVTAGASAVAIVAKSTTKVVAIILKWLAVSVGVGAVAVGIVRLTSHPEAPPVLAPPPTQIAIVAPPPTVISLPDPVPTPNPAPDPTPTAAPTHTPPPPSNLSAQTALIDKARQAQSRGDVTAALAETDRYRAQYPNGPFADEATLIRVQSLDARGDHEQAHKEAAAFVAAHPQSLYASALRKF